MDKESINIEELGMKISIIVPFFNAEKTIEKSIESLTKQKNVDLELVLVDDQSTDASFSLCDKYAKQDCRIILTSSDHKGVSAARNKGLECCTGDIVGFCDADDYYESNVLEKIEKVFVDETQCDLVITGFNVCFQDKRIESRLSNKTYKLLGEKLFFSKLLNDPNTMGAVWNKFFKRELLTDIRFNTEISLCEDTLFCAQLVKDNRDIYIYSLPVVTYNYFQNSESVTSNENKLFDENNSLKYYEFIDLLTSQYEFSKYEIRQVRCARARLAYNTLNGFKLDLEKRNKLIDEIENNRGAFIRCGVYVGKRTYLRMILKMIWMRNVY